MDTSCIKAHVSPQTVLLPKILTRSWFLAQPRPRVRPGARRASKATLSPTQTPAPNAQWPHMHQGGRLSVHLVMLERKMGLADRLHALPVILVPSPLLDSQRAPLAQRGKATTLKANPRVGPLAQLVNFHWRERLHVPNVRQGPIQAQLGLAPVNCAPMESLLLPKASVNASGVMKLMESQDSILALEMWRVQPVQNAHQLGTTEARVAGGVQGGVFNVAE